MKKHPAVDSFLDSTSQWQTEMRLIREIVLDSGLEETFKWSSPCYTFGGKNVVIIAGFKGYCALSFFKGSLLKDPKSLLSKPGDNSQASRLFKFEKTEDIEALEPTIKSYLKEAIEIEKQGKKVDFDQSKNFELVQELQERLETDAELRKAFESLTVGRQRGYNIYFSGAKKSESRKSRIEKFIPKILAGKGFHDCTCGLSKRYPTCDGSHKQLENQS